MEPSMPNTDRVARPSMLTPEDVRRMDARIAAYDRARAARRRKRALSRLIAVAIWGGLLICLFYSATN